MEKINPDLQTTHLVNQVDVTAAPLLRLANDEPFSLFKRSIHHSYDELLNLKNEFNIFVFVCPFDISFLFSK